jgi:hypothetical protein
MSEPSVQKYNETEETARASCLKYTTDLPDLQRSRPSEAEGGGAEASKQAPYRPGILGILGNKVTGCVDALPDLAMQQRQLGGEAIRGGKSAHCCRRGSGGRFALLLLVGQADRHAGWTGRVLDVLYEVGEGGGGQREKGRLKA